METRARLTLGLLAILSPACVVFAAPDEETEARAAETGRSARTGAEAAESGPAEDDVAAEAAAETPPTAPKKKKKPKVKVQGRLGLGAESTAPQGKVDNLFEMRVGIKTPKIENTRAYVEVRADEDTRDVSIQDVFFDYRTDDEASRIRAGRGKKIIGWEYDGSTSERLGLSRTLVYQYLEERAIVGRDYFVQYRWRRADPKPKRKKPAAESGDAEVAGDEPEEPKSADPDLDTAVVDPSRVIDPYEKLRLALAFHSSDSKDLALIASAVATLSPAFRLGAWAAVHGARNSYRRTDHPQFALAGQFQRGAHRAALELFAGGDPYRTEMERFYGFGRKVRYGAIKAEYALLFFGRWSPYAIRTRLWRDLEHRGDRTDETILGLRLYVGEFLQVAGELRRNESRNQADPATRPYRYDTAGVLARYYF